MYLALVLIGQYCPIGAQILCIWFAIKGNWNELLQGDLKPPDLSISVNSHMFQDFKRVIEHESILRSRLSSNINLKESPLSKKSKSLSKSENKIHESSRILKNSDIYSDDLSNTSRVNYKSLLIQ